VRPVRAGLHLLAAVIQLHRDRFGWTAYPTAVNPRGEGHFERLVGRAGLRQLLEEQPADLAERLAEATAAPGWPDRVRRVLVYS